MGALNRGRRKESEPESREHHLDSGDNGESLQILSPGVTYVDCFERKATPGAPHGEGKLGGLGAWGQVQ